MKTFTSTTNRVFRSLALALFLGLVYAGVSSGQTPKADETAQKTPDRPGLLILTHGSPAPMWGTALETLVAQVQQENEIEKKFAAVEGANLEFCAPDAAAGIERLQDAGCTRIIVVPAFIFPTSHSHFDVPAVLGLYSSPSIRETLQTENARVAAPRVPITVTQTLSEGDLLAEYVLDETAALSTSPADEALLLIAHGDEGHAGLIDPEMKRLVTRTCGRIGLAEGDWAYCEVGQSYRQNVLPKIQAFAADGKTPLVVGLYLMTSPERLNAAAKKAPRLEMIPETEPTPDEKTAEPRFSPNGVITHKKTAPFILKTAAEAL